METYVQLRNRHQEEVNNFPIGFAFNDKQLEEELQRLETKASDCISIGAGGFIRKKDKEIFVTMMRRHKKEMKEAMKDEEFAYQAFLCELQNHEYSYTEDPEDALNALGLSVFDIENNPVLNKAYVRAERDASYES